MTEGKTPKFAIYVVQHKPSQTLSDAGFTPIFVGRNSAAMAEEWDGEGAVRPVSDATGDHISARNDSYCELTAMYWAWKNGPKTDHVGFMHYRRHLNFSHRRLEEDRTGVVEYACIDSEYERTNRLDSARVAKLLQSYDLLLPRKWNVTEAGARDLYEQYQISRDHFIGDYDKAIEIVLEMHPDYAQNVKQVNQAKSGYFTNMFVMRRGQFESYCSWLFPILERLEKEIDISQYSTQQARVYGYISERLFNIFLSKYLEDNPNTRVKELQRTFVRHTDPARPIVPAFDGNAVPLVLSFDDKFSKYAGALVASIRENASPERSYDIVVLHRDISAENRALFSGMLAGRENISIRFYDVSQFVLGMDLPVHAHFSAETYFRLFIPRIFSHYPKVIYLDSDMVALSDLAPLYDIDIGDSLVAAVRDCVMEGMRKFETKSLRATGGLPAQKYLASYLGLRRPEDYFQAGLIVFNNAAILRTSYLGDVVAAIKARPFWFLDQDILNLVLQGRVHFIDMKWNTFFGNGDTGTFFENLPKATRDEFFAALSSPHVLHFAGDRKPWNHVGISYGHEFWRHSRNTPWYEEVLALASARASTSEEVRAREVSTKNKRSRFVSVLESLRAIGYILLPISKRRRAKRKKLLAGLRDALA